MNKKTYIAASSCISAQNTFVERDRFLNLISPENAIFKCVEPDFRNFIDAASLRRMNKLQKYNLCTAIDCLKSFDRKIDASIYASGWGCIESTYRFIERIFDGRNLPVNPAAFIQSTHNAPAAQTAIHFKQHSYNNIITDNYLAFELALDNALLCLQDDDCSNVLISAADELTPQLADILQKIRKSKQTTVLGEGCASFVLTKDKAAGIAELKHFESFNRVDYETGFDKKINDLCKLFSINCIFSAESENFSETVPQINYTDYFGHFPVCSACGFWLAINALTTQGISQNIEFIPPSKNIMMIAKNRDKMGYLSVISVNS